MSKPVEFNGANKILQPPKNYDKEQVIPMYVFTNGIICVSKWKLSEEALKEVKETGCLFVSLISGYTQPPIFI